MKRVRIVFNDGEIEYHYIEAAGVLEPQARVVMFKLHGEKAMLSVNLDTVRGWMVTEDE